MVLDEWHVTPWFNIMIREHDKGPEEFCSVLMKMMDDNLEFVVSILGEHTNDIPGRQLYIDIMFLHESKTAVTLVFTATHYRDRTVVK